MQRKPIYIADNIHKTITLSEIEKDIISTKLYNRLHDIFQNSTAYLTFPSNRHNRFEHSLGTMKLCGDMFFYSVSNSDEKTISDFFKDAKGNLKQLCQKTINSDNYIDGARILLEDKNMPRLRILDLDITRDIEKLINNIIEESTTIKKPFTLKDYEDIINNDNISNIKNVDFGFKSVFYNTIIPSNLSKNLKYTYLVLYQAIRLTALLHDIGHPPFSHITEGALNKIYKKVTNKKDLYCNKQSEEKLTDREEIFLDIMGKYYKKDIQLHENIGNQMIIKIFRNYLEKNTEYPFEIKKFYLLVFESVLSILNEDNLFWGSIHRIIDGTLDGDRLDYVSRDLNNSGIDQGIIEYGRLIPSMKIYTEESTEESKKIYLFIPEAKTVSTIEDFFQKRWYLYKNILYHHRVIKTDSLLKDSIIDIAIDYLSDTTSESFDKDIKVLPYDISGLWISLTNEIDSDVENFNLLIQWNDSWLMTILKKHYYEDYSVRDECSTKYKLDELLSNKKHYYAVIKNKLDMEILNKKILAHIENDVHELIKNINKRIKVLSEKQENLEDKENYELILSTNVSNAFKGSIPHNYPMIYRLNYIFKPIIKKLKEDVIIDTISWTKKFLDYEYIHKDKLNDFLVINKEISTGLTIEPILHQNDEIFKLSDISVIENNLTEDAKMFPFMFIYLNFKEYPNKDRNKVYEELLSALGEFLSKKIKDKYIDNFSDIMDKRIDMMLEESVL